MAAKKVGTLIKEARLAAEMTQEQLARRISGLSASDISMAERGLKDLTQEQLKRIAKVTGVTQASLLNAAKGSAKKTSSSTAAKTSMRVTATEKRLVELYREASSDKKKAVLNVLRGNDATAGEIFDTILEGVQDIITGK
ncbi:MAG: helix-turn-helix domain-containing protein [Oscillospiraceae bacterium]|nr:helix-turn-helix domain-containing protein [Oscillospiraceae bacterium]